MASRECQRCHCDKNYFIGEICGDCYARGVDQPGTTQVVVAVEKDAAPKIPSPTKPCPYCHEAKTNVKDHMTRCKQRPELPAKIEQPTVVRKQADLDNLHLSTTKAEDIPVLQSHLSAWCGSKIKVLRDELKDYRQCRQMAEKSKHPTAPFLRAIGRTQKRLTFYEKVNAALLQGYCLFPPIEGAEVFAVRVKKKTHYEGRTDDYWRGHNVRPEMLAFGEGHFVSDNPVIWGQWVDDPKAPEKRKQEFWADGLKQVEFPVQLIKPELMAIANKAMEEKIFDELAVVSGRTDDPVLIGNILRPNKTRVSFFLAWFLDTRNL